MFHEGCNRKYQESDRDLFREADPSNPFGKTAICPNCGQPLNSYLMRSISIPTTSYREYVCEGWNEAYDVPERKEDPRVKAAQREDYLHRYGD